MRERAVYIELEDSIGRRRGISSRMSAAGLVGSRSARAGLVRRIGEVVLGKGLGWTGQYRYGLRGSQEYGLAS